MPNSSESRAVGLILQALRQLHRMAGPAAPETLVALHPSATSPDRVNRVLLFHSGRAVYFYLTHQCPPGCSLTCRSCPYSNSTQPACWIRRALLERDDFLHLLRLEDHQALLAWELRAPEGDDTFLSFTAREVGWLFAELLN